MKRREFITLFGGATAWPLVARAQQPAMPVIGFIHSASLERRREQVVAYREGLKEAGFVEGRNVSIEYRWAENQYHQLPELAADLVRRHVTVIAAMGAPTAQAAKAATSTIPIVFMTSGDPVRSGLISSLNRPGGNLTGVSEIGEELEGKRLGLLHELMPGATRIAMLINPNSPFAESLVAQVRTGASLIGLQIEVLTASDSQDIDTAFASLAQKHVGGLLISVDPLFLSRRVQLAMQAVRHLVPTIFPIREDAEAGGLMSYGASNTDVYRQAGVYTGRILNGEKPAEMPVQQPTKFQFVVNLQTAKVIGLEVPPTLLARADEVIE
jgi:putative tryptophan/tyrosine transport system substrate-binding protein